MGVTLIEVMAEIPGKPLVEYVADVEVRVVVIKRDKLVEGEVELLGMKREGVNAKTFGDSMFDI